MADLTYAFDFSPSSQAFSLAINLVVISFVLSAFALGISRAIRSKKLWSWGSEELAQALVNAALLGAIVGSASLVGSLVGSANSLVDANNFSACPYFFQNQNSPIAYSLCSIEDSQSKAWSVLSAVESQAFSLGVLSSINLDFNVVSAAPFTSLSYSASNYSSWASELSFVFSSFEFNKQFLFFIAQSGFSLFLPVGLLLRMFFATRKLGGALIGGAIAFFVIYPLMYCAFVTDSSALEGAYDVAYTDLDELSQTLAFVPSIDWGKTPDMAGLINSLDGVKLSEKVALPYKSVSVFVGAISVYAFLYPLISLVISLICARELALLLGSEFRLELFEKI